MFYLCKGLNHTEAWEKKRIKPEACGFTQPRLLISLIIMNQSISEPSNLPNLLFSATLTAQHLTVAPLVVFTGSGGVGAPSVSIRGDGSQPRVQKREISPLKWNMELRFDWKGGTVWVTSVNTHLPWGVLSLKLLLAGAGAGGRWVKRGARPPVSRWLTHCW